MTVDEFKEKTHSLIERMEGKPDFDFVKVFGLDNVSMEDLKKQYKDFGYIVCSSGYGGRFMGAEGKILKEEAQATLSIEETKKELLPKFGFESWQLGTTQGAHGIQLAVLIAKLGSNVTLLKDAMAACGWSFSTINETDLGGMTWLGLTFDPMFQDNVENDMRKYHFLYHWTPLYNYEKIKKEGLKPLSNNSAFNYPNRIHLLNGNLRLEEIIDFGQVLCEKNRNPNNNGKYVLLAISTTQIPKGTEVFFDPRFENGYYLNVPISPEAINVARGFDFNTMKPFNI